MLVIFYLAIIMFVGLTMYYAILVAFYCHMPKTSVILPLFPVRLLKSHPNLKFPRPHSGAKGAVGLTREKWRHRSWFRARPRATGAIYIIIGDPDVHTPRK